MSAHRGAGEGMALGAIGLGFDLKPLAEWIAEQR
jgi:hypothetical protein